MLSRGLFCKKNFLRDFTIFTRFGGQILRKCKKKIFENFLSLEIYVN